jgi:hypothetical protein
MTCHVEALTEKQIVYGQPFDGRFLPVLLCAVVSKPYLPSRYKSHPHLSIGLMPCFQGVSAAMQPRLVAARGNYFVRTAVAVPQHRYAFRPGP